jgi:hypothetical protein
MPDQDQRPDQHQWPFSKPLEFLHKVKYGGAVGKKTVITVVALIVLAIGIVSIAALRGSVVSILLLAMLAVGVFVWALASIDRTLVKHPELALLDGTEFVALRKAEMAAAKNMKVVDITPAIPDPTRPTRQITTATPIEEEE